VDPFKDAAVKIEKTAFEVRILLLNGKWPAKTDRMEKSREMKMNLCWGQLLWGSMFEFEVRLDWHQSSSLAILRGVT
jgi:hypothetical protein